jgi:NDP-sugar pyrophosphorylase family protein
MTIKPTLLVLAAGMGSRYGGLKQLDVMGPGNETIMDYSIYDALRAGFGRIVFVIRDYFQEDFRSVFADRFGSGISIDFVSQELNKIPQGYSYSPERNKPWGTAHALMMGKYLINEPFAVINADDFYGRDAFRVLADFLRESVGKSHQYGMVAYRLSNTLSEQGNVSRGICQTDLKGYLTDVEEHHQIRRQGDSITGTDVKGELKHFADQTFVSMNMWGFTPDIFEEAENLFKEFLLTEGQEMKSEFYIPRLVNELITAGKARTKLLQSESQWFGVTYREDRPMVEERLHCLISEGEYPRELWTTNQDQA